MTPGLIERLEAAGGGSRELDAEIARLFGGQAIARFGDWDCREDGTGIWRPLPRYSSSLDAALALAERVLPGYCVGVCQADQTSWGAWIGARPAFARRYSTAPLALVIAILKARATLEQG